MFTFLFLIQNTSFKQVDLLPEDDRISYACPKNPTHLATRISKNNYKLIKVPILAFKQNFKAQLFRYFKENSTRAILVVLQK
jgi:hypothetical protein